MRFAALTLFLLGLLGVLPGGGANLHAADLLAAGPSAAESVVHQGAVILMYHRFGEDRIPSTNIRVSQFEAHLAELQRGQYRVVPVPEIVQALKMGRPLPSRTIGITVDDAYLSVFTKAWPRLNRAGFPFTLFVSTDAVDRKYRGMLSWDQIRRMVQSGRVTIGNHTASHPHLADWKPDSMRREMAKAGARIEEEVGVKPTLFAYPYGEYGLAARNVAVGMGFEAAFGQHSGAIGPGSDRYALPRFALNEAYGDSERFRRVIETLPLPVRDVLPLDVLLGPETNPPLFGFTLAEGVGSLDGVRCYLAGQGVLRMRKTGGWRLEGRPERPFTPGRTRINCTLAAGKGRWRWFGLQFFLPEP